MHREWGRVQAYGLYDFGYPMRIERNGPRGNRFWRGGMGRASDADGDSRMGAGLAADEFCDLDVLGYA